MYKINAKDKNQGSEKFIIEKNMTLPADWSKARTLGLLLTDNGGSLEMVSRKVALMKLTLEEAEAGGRMWLRLQGTAAGRKSLQRDIVRVHAARNDQAREKPVEVPLCERICHVKINRT